MNLKTNPSMTIHKIVLKDRNVMVAKGVMRAMIKIYTYNIQVDDKIEPHPHLHSFLFVLIYVAVISNIG